MYINFWRSLGTLQFILNVIGLGYKNPFCYLPTPFFKANNASAFSNSLFVSHAVNELLHANLHAKDNSGFKAREQFHLHQTKV